MIRSLCLVALIAAFSLGMAPPALAQEPAARPDRPLADPAREARARALFEDIRCVVCQHESIADSPAGLAADMRALVRDQIATGASDDQVRADLVARWGDYILFTPPVSPSTWLLWFGPALLIAGAGAVILIRIRRRNVTPARDEAPLSPGEAARLDTLLADVTFGPDTNANWPKDRL